MSPDKEVSELRRAILLTSVGFLFAALLVSPVLAIGPVKTEGKNPNVVIHGFNTQMWLSSAVMNEWIENPTLPGPVAVTVKDSSKFQIKNAYIIDNQAMAGMVFMMENQWVKVSQSAFGAFLAMLGFDPSLSEGFPDGIYMQLVYVGWSAEDLPPPP